MPLIDFKRWMVYFSVFPRWDPWWAMSRVCTAIVGKFQGRPARISDFYPRLERRRERLQSPDRVVAGLDRMFGGVADGEDPPQA